jgi:hypothetical protein
MADVERMRERKRNGNEERETGNYVHGGCNTEVGEMR